MGYKNCDKNLIKLYVWLLVKYLIKSLNIYVNVIYLIKLVKCV